jgi:ribosomal-protein-alanine N-acetyltransferase
MEFNLKRPNVGSSFTIRVFRINDIERVMYINSRCLPENYSSYFFRDLYSKYPQTFLVAEVGGKIQGYILCRIERGWSKKGLLRPAKLCHIVSIAVMKNYRRKGIGKGLIIEAMGRGRRVYDCNEGYLEVRISNEAAIGLYDNLGFSKIKRNYGYYIDGEDAWVMAASLNDF